MTLYSIELTFWTPSNYKNTFCYKYVIPKGLFPLCFEGFTQSEALNIILSIDTLTQVRASKVCNFETKKPARKLAGSTTT
ncbi:hypothetical protein JCM15579A_15940 [Marinifilum fragile]